MPVGAGGREAPVGLAPQQGPARPGGRAHDRGPGTRPAAAEGRRPLADLSSRRLRGGARPPAPVRPPVLAYGPLTGPLQRHATPGPGPRAGSPWRRRLARGAAVPGRRWRRDPATARPYRIAGGVATPQQRGRAGSAVASPPGLA